MSGLIVCTKKEGAKPYYITQAGVSISSLEELCYFLYNNIYVVNSEIIDEKLIMYIENELQEKPLSDELREMNSYKVGLGEMVMAILKYTNYYSESEIEDIKKLIESLNTQNMFERLKLRGDNFLASNRYLSAIESYTMIISQKKDKTLSEQFYGKVWHNLGVAFAKMLLFTKAKECFLKAYKISGTPESEIQFITATILADNRNKEFVREEFENGEEKELYNEIKNQIDALTQNVWLQEEYMDLIKAKQLKEDGLISEYYKKIEDVIGNWKLEYQKLIY